jgi:membrane-bound lytic murein transglycosylase D
MLIPTLVLLAQMASQRLPADRPSRPPAKSSAAPVTGSTVTPDSTADETEMPEEVEKQSAEQSAEMEELRALEEVVLDPSAKPNAEILQAMRRLGVANPLRERMEGAFAEPETREDVSPLELPRITDLAKFDISQVKNRYDIPMEMQPLVAQYIQFFQGPGRKWFRKWMSRSTRYIPAMEPILESQGLPKDTVYLAMIESGFSAHAYSWARAAGPWQFISATARLYGLKQDFWVDERRDPLKSTQAAARYLRQLYEDLGDWYLAWAAYNAGGRKVSRVMERKGTSDFWQLSDGRGLAKETKHYVPKLIACALIAKHPKAFGFKDDEFSYLTPLETDEVKLTDAVDLETLAKAAEIGVDEIRDLNPELKRWCTPPASAKQPYLLRLPKGTGEKFTGNIAKLGPQARLAFRVHRVKRGDTLSRIAASYRSAPEAILRLNGLRSVKLLRVNAELVVPVPSTQGKPDPALERQIAKARRGGFAAVRPEEEIPAGTLVRRPVATGPLTTEVVDGKTRMTYGVQSGDTLWALSQRFNCTVDELREWNRLPKKKKALQIGSVLVVWPKAKTVSAQGAQDVFVWHPESASAAQPGAQKRSVHQLAEGETLSSVAQHYGVSVEDIQRWNGIADPQGVRAGQELTVLGPK